MRGNSQAKAEAIRTLFSLTREMCVNGCLMAKYLSPLITNRWRIDTPASMFIRERNAINEHKSLLQLTKIDIKPAMNTGWAKLPATKSVVASRAIAILDLGALSRRLVFTTIITNALRTAVKGKEKRLMIIFKIRQNWAKGEGFLVFLSR